MNKLIAILMMLSTPSFAGVYQNFEQNRASGTATLRIVNKIEVVASTFTLSTPTITLDGVTGLINGVDITALGANTGLTLVSSRALTVVQSSFNLVGLDFVSEKNYYLVFRTTHTGPTSNGAVFHTENPGENTHFNCVNFHRFGGLSFSTSTHSHDNADNTIYDMQVSDRDATVRCEIWMDVWPKAGGSFPTVQYECTAFYGNTDTSAGNNLQVERNYCQHTDKNQDIDHFSEWWVEAASAGNDFGGFAYWLYKRE